MALLSELTTEQLKRAVEIKEQIEALKNELDDIIGGGIARRGRPPGRPRLGRPLGSVKRRGRPPGSGRKVKMTPERLAALARAREARWGKARATSADNGRKKRKFSATWRAKIAAAAKARWAKAKAAG